MAVWLLKNYKALYFDQVRYYPSSLSSKSLIIQVSYHPSPSSTKPHSSSLHQSRFFLLCPSSRLEGFFIDNIYTLLSFGFLPHPPHRLGGFSLINPLSGFPPQFPNGLGGFSPAIQPFETHQLPYGAKMFSVAPRFSSPVFFIGLGGFSPGSHSYLQRFYAQRSSRPKKEAIVITWLLEPERRASEAEVTWRQSSRFHPGQLGLHLNASPSRALI